MTTGTQKLSLWGPRILGVLFGLFVGVFSLDALGEGSAAFLLHTLPAVLVLLLVTAAWRWEWVGGAAFPVLAAAYALFAWRRGHPEWAWIISGPLLILGVLYLLSWRHHEELRAAGRGPGAKH